MTKCVYVYTEDIMKEWEKKDYIFSELLLTV